MVSPAVILFLVWVDGVCVCVCVPRESVRRGCNYFQLGVHYEYVLETSSFGFSNLRYYLCVRHNVDTGCDVSRRVHVFGAMQITRELCFDEGGMMMSFRE